MNSMMAIILLGPVPDTAPLAAETPVADRGEVRTGPILTQTFQLTHTGKVGSLTITGIDATCGCLQPTASKSVLQPGEQCTVTILVNTLTQPPGPNTWRATVRYRTDPDAVNASHSLELKITAQLVREVSVHPPQVEISTADTASQTITVTDTRSSPLTIHTATTNHPHLAAELLPASKDARTRQIKLAVGPDFPTGRHDETLVMTTSDPQCRELRVPVRITKRPRASVAAYPESVTVRFAREQSEASSVVQVRRPGGGPVKIDRVECSHPACQARWSTESGPVASVRVIVTRSKITDMGSAELRVILAEPAGTELRIPVAWQLP